jgi:hypothetical protein
MKAGDVMVVTEDHLVGMTARYVLPRAAHGQVVRDLYPHFFGATQASVTALSMMCR